MEISEQLGRQARPGFEPSTSRLAVWSVTAMPLVGRYGLEPYSDGYFWRRNEISSLKIGVKI